MDKKKIEIKYAGLLVLEQGFAGIDTEFMVKNGLLIVCTITKDNEGAIMLHPHLDGAMASVLIPYLDELNKLAKQVLEGADGSDGELH